MEADHIDDIKTILMVTMSNIIAMIIMFGSSVICEATNPEDVSISAYFAWVKALPGCRLALQHHSISSVRITVIA